MYWAVDLKGQSLCYGKKHEVFFAYSLFAARPKSREPFGIHLQNSEDRIQRTEFRGLNSEGAIWNSFAETEDKTKASGK